MKNIAMTAVAALLLSASLAACSDNTAEPDEATATTPTAPDGAPATPATTTADNASIEYVEKAAIGDMFEVESSKLALERSQVAEVKTFAQQMIDAHTATTNELKPVASAAGINPPAAMDDKHAGMLEDLRKASAEDFDDKYIDQQTAAHNDALNLHKNYAENGNNAGMKAFAGATWPKVQEHLDHVKALDDSNADDKTPG